MRLSAFKLVLDWVNLLSSALIFDSFQSVTNGDVFFSLSLSLFFPLICRSIHHSDLKNFDGGI